MKPESATERLIRFLATPVSLNAHLSVIFPCKSVDPGAGLSDPQNYIYMRRITVFWDVTPCSLVKILKFFLEERTALRVEEKPEIGTHLQDQTVAQPRQLQYEFSLTREPTGNVEGPVSKFENSPREFLRRLARFSLPFFALSEKER
jgi:hypothetical protein